MASAIMVNFIISPQKLSLGGAGGGVLSMWSSVIRRNFNTCSHLTQERNMRHNIRMSYIIAGLGNPGEEYKDTRHNTGRIIAEHIAKKFSFDEFKENPKLKGLYSRGTIEKEKVEIVLPDNYMNRSGASLLPLVTSVKKAHNLIVIYDDLDLGIGTIKISYNRSSGGHRGLESIIKTLKTQEFVRIRVGISPVTPAGTLKKPHGDAEVDKHIIGPFKKPEMELLTKKIAGTVTDAVVMIIKDGYDAAMGKFNSNK